MRMYRKNGDGTRRLHSGPVKGEEDQRRGTVRSWKLLGDTSRGYTHLELLKRYRIVCLRQQPETYV